MNKPIKPTKPEKPLLSQPSAIETIEYAFFQHDDKKIKLFQVSNISEEKLQSEIDNGWHPLDEVSIQQLNQLLKDNQVDNKNVSLSCDSLYKYHDEVYLILTYQKALSALEIDNATKTYEFKVNEHKKALEDYNKALEAYKKQKAEYDFYLAKKKVESIQR